MERCDLLLRQAAIVDSSVVETTTKNTSRRAAEIIDGPEVHIVTCGRDSSCLCVLANLVSVNLKADIDLIVGNDDMMPRVR